MSLIEAIANVLVGFGLAVLTQIAVFPLFGLRAFLGDNLALGGMFEAIRLRRWAETRHSTSEHPCTAG